MVFDRYFFPYCPSCGKVVRLFLHPCGVPASCYWCGGQRVFPLVWKGPMWFFAFYAYVFVGIVIWLVWLPLFPLLAVVGVVTGIRALGFRYQGGRLWYWFCTLIQISLAGPPRQGERPRVQQL